MAESTQDLLTGNDITSLKDLVAELNRCFAGTGIEFSKTKSIVVGKPLPPENVLAINTSGTIDIQKLRALRHESDLQFDRTSNPSQILLTETLIKKEGFDEIANKLVTIDFSQLYIPRVTMESDTKPGFASDTAVHKAPARPKLTSRGIPLAADFRSREPDDLDGESDDARPMASCEGWLSKLTKRLWRCDKDEDGHPKHYTTLLVDGETPDTITSQLRQHIKETERYKIPNGFTRPSSLAEGSKTEYCLPAFPEIYALRQNMVKGLGYRAHIM